MSFHKYRSPALKQFWTNLKEVGVIMSLVKLNSLKQRNVSAVRQRTISESLYRSAMLLLCSNTEKFFESIAIDVLNFHESRNTPVIDLPKQLRATQILKPKFSEFWSSLTTEKSWSKIEEICTSDFADASGQCKEGLFNAELHTKFFTSPKSNNVEKLFSSIGIETIWTKVNDEVLKKGLDSFVSRRDVITHEGLAIGRSDRPTAADVTGFIRDVCKIVFIFNKIVSKYLVNQFNVSGDPWLLKLQ